MDYLGYLYLVVSNCVNCPIFSDPKPPKLWVETPLKLFDVCTWTLTIWIFREV